MSKGKRILLKRTLILQNVGKEFYHPDVPKAEQMMTATLDYEAGTIDVYVFEDNQAEQIKELEESLMFQKADSHAKQTWIESQEKQIKKLREQNLTMEVEILRFKALKKKPNPDNNSFDEHNGTTCFD